MTRYPVPYPHHFHVALCDLLFWMVNLLRACYQSNLTALTVCRKYLIFFHLRIFLHVNKSPSKSLQNKTMWFWRRNIFLFFTAASFCVTKMGFSACSPLDSCMYILELSRVQYANGKVMYTGMLQKVICHGSFCCRTVVLYWMNNGVSTDVWVKKLNRKKKRMYE